MGSLGRKQEPEEASISRIPLDPLGKKALMIATKAHAGQFRKLGGGPYIIHPVAVALKLFLLGFSDKVVAAALAHDVLEDTDFSEVKLTEELGVEVASIVKAVTNDASLPWKEKKKRYIESVRNGPEGAKAVCAADKIHNLSSLIDAYKTYGEMIWKKFNADKKDQLWFQRGVLKMLRESWDHPMVAEYEKLIERFKGITVGPESDAD